MASVNKQSLREEFDTLKGRFEHLVADGKMTGESRALVEALLMLLQLLMAVFLEKRTPKGSRKNNFPFLAADPSRLTALLVAYIFPICALLAPCQAGASTPKNGKLFLREP